MYFKATICVKYRFLFKVTFHGQKIALIYIYDLCFIRNSLAEDLKWISSR